MNEMHPGACVNVNKLFELDKQNHPWVFIESIHSRENLRLE